MNDQIQPTLTPQQLADIKAGLALANTTDQLRRRRYLVYRDAAVIWLPVASAGLAFNSLFLLATIPVCALPVVLVALRWSFRSQPTAVSVYEQSLERQGLRLR